MKNRLRLALPPLASLQPDSLVPFALLDRDNTILRSGELPLSGLADAVPSLEAQAILHPDDAVVVKINVPPVTGNRLDMAVQSLVEPMALSDTDTLCIAHGARQPDGSAQVTWAEREALMRGWRLLSAAGLKVQSILPLALALPANDPHPGQHLSLPADARWQTELPKWSLARQEWRPATDQRRWRTPLIWIGAAVLVWLVGLNIHASQRHAETTALNTQIERSVRGAFPDLSVIIDPVRQAENARDALRLARGTSAEDDFLPLALATAQALTGVDGLLARLVYDKGELRLSLNEGYTPPPEASLRQASASQGLDITRDEKMENTWIIRRARDLAPGASR